MEHNYRSFAKFDYSIETVRTMAARLGCGDNIWAAVCERAHIHAGPEHAGKHTYRRITSSCHRTVCEVCGDDVVKGHARELTQKLKAIKTECYKAGVDLRYRQGRRSCYYVELILSPPEGEYDNYDTLDGYKKMFKEATKYAEDIGMVGGIGVMHAIRGSEKQIEAFIDGRAPRPDFSPHFHFIGFMPHRHQVKSDKFYEETCWVYKVVPKWKWQQSKRTLFEKMCYELDHACVWSHTFTVSDNKWGERERTQHGQLTRHFGICHHSRIQKIETYTDEHCKDCGGLVYTWNRETMERSDEPNQVLVSRVFVFRPGAIEACIKKYHLRVEPPHAETLTAFTDTE